MLTLCFSCGFSVTNKHQKADTNVEQEVQRAVLDELTKLDERIRDVSEYDINSILDPAKIDVSVKGSLVSLNLGDGVIHMSVWENLTEQQQLRVGQWFGGDPKATYEKFFYRFLTVSQGMKQLQFNILTVPWVYKNRSIFGVERDSIRGALGYYAWVGEPAMWQFVEQICGRMVDQYDDTYGPNYNAKYLLNNIGSLLDNFENPVGYVYFICRWVQTGLEVSPKLGFPGEVAFLESLKER